MRTKAFYDAANITGDNYEYVDDNFTEGYYYDNTIISSKQAEYQKFDEFIVLAFVWWHLYYKYLKKIENENR